MICDFTTYLRAITCLDIDPACANHIKFFFKTMKGEFVVTLYPMTMKTRCSKVSLPQLKNLQNRVSILKIPPEFILAVEKDCSWIAESKFNPYECNLNSGFVEGVFSEVNNV